jgi:mannose-6-phosphate isomerase
MTMELASTTVVRKPWGKTDLRPWSELGNAGPPVGELWFERADRQAPATDLLLKLLFTEAPLSIQVHPDDWFARAIGLPHGKTEAWYVLSAGPDAQVALGLTGQLTAAQLRAAVADGTIEGLADWQDVIAGEALLVPAGTIHAIGAGLVIAEIQQRSDATFRLFDYGRERALHLDAGVGASKLGPAPPQAVPSRLSEAREVMAVSRYFVLERIELAPNSQWAIEAVSETWMLVLEGEATFDQMPVAAGAAIFLDDQRATVRTGDRAAKGLMAYVASRPIEGLLQSRNGIPIEVIAARFPELGLTRPPGDAATQPEEKRS